MTWGHTVVQAALFWSLLLEKDWNFQLACNKKTVIFPSVNRIISAAHHCICSVPMQCHVIVTRMQCDNEAWNRVSFALALLIVHKHKACATVCSPSVCVSIYTSQSAATLSVESPGESSQDPIWWCLWRGTSAGTGELLSKAAAWLLSQMDWCVTGGLHGVSLKLSAQIRAGNSKSPETRPIRAGRVSGQRTDLTHLRLFIKVTDTAVWAVSPPPPFPLPSTPSVLHRKALAGFTPPTACSALRQPQGYHPGKGHDWQGEAFRGLGTPQPGGATGGEKIKPTGVLAASESPQRVFTYLCLFCRQTSILTFVLSMRVWGWASAPGGCL